MADKIKDNIYSPSTYDFSKTIDHPINYPTSVGTHYKLWKSDSDNSSAQNPLERGKNVDLYIDEDVLNDFKKMFDKSHWSAEEIEEMEIARKVIFYGIENEI